ncbi:MAG: nitrilase-related carbon-nitrogen hydrolase [Thermodesulfobacteriota bacterium]
MMNDIRIAAVIFRSPIDEVPETLDRMAGYIDMANREEVEIICFPEMGVTGYGIRKSIRKSARPLTGSIPEALKEMAKQGKMVILAGMAEKGENDAIHASHLVVPPQGKTRVYRKLHIAPPEKEIYTTGNKIPVFDISGIRFGIQLCYDTHFPDLSTTMALKGADVLFFPHASPRGTPIQKFNSWMRHLPARAYDNGVFVVACNAVGKNEEGLTFPGIAVIIGPDGKVIAKKASTREEILIATLKKSDLISVRKNRMAYFLPNRRPELYRTC